MAGRTRYKALADELALRTRRTFEDDPQATSLDYVCHWIENGQTAKALATDITVSLRSYPVPFDVDYALLMRHLRHEYGDEGDNGVTARVEQARSRASHCLAEESLDIVDAPAETQTEVSRAASRARSRQWLAQAWNQRSYGQQKGVSVSLSIGSLHLDALKARPQQAIARVTGLPALPALPPVRNTPPTDDAG